MKKYYIITTALLLAITSPSAHAMNKRGGDELEQPKTKKVKAAAKNEFHECPKCGAPYIRKSMLMHHIKRGGCVIETKNEVPNQKPFHRSNKHSPAAHQALVLPPSISKEIHPASRTCIPCGRMFPSRPALKKHNETHHVQPTLLQPMPLNPLVLQEIHRAQVLAALAAHQMQQRPPVQPAPQAPIAPEPSADQEDDEVQILAVVRRGQEQS